MVIGYHGIASYPFLFSGIVWRRRIFIGHGCRRLLPSFFWGKLGHGHAGDFLVWRCGSAVGRVVLGYFAFVAEGLHQQALFQL